MRRTRALVPIVALALIGAGPFSASAGRRAGGTRSGCAWTQVPIPLPPGATGRGSLEDVTAFSDADAWAVGTALKGARFVTLVEHWDGSQWSISPTSKGPGAGGNTLAGVGGSSSEDLWAVGQWFGSGAGHGPLVEHWDGTTWTIASDGTWVGSGLNSVTAIAPDDAWAVGLLLRRPLIEHWDGTGWSSILVPHISDYATLNGVDGSGSDDVWAVGYDTLTDWQTLVMHYDGVGWTVVPSPTPGVRGLLEDVVSVSPTEAWAVGAYEIESGQPMRRLVERWDGTAWSVVQSPPRPKRQTWLESVAETSTGIVAVGHTDTQDYRKSKPWGVELSGAAWSTVAIPPPPADMSGLHAIAALPRGNALAVGSTVDVLANESPLAYAGCV